MCLFLAVLMILGCVSAIAIVFASKNVAADTEDYAFPNDLIAVGLECGKNEVAVGFEVSTTNGFVVNEVTIARDQRSSDRIYSLSDHTVTIVNDANLSKVSGKYVEYDGKSAAIGGYHLELKEVSSGEGDDKTWKKLDIKTESALKKAVEDVDKLLSGTSYNAIPSYIDNSYTVRVGDFSTADRAQDALDGLDKLKEKYNVEIVQPSSTGVSIVEANFNRVLFEYDCFTQLGLSTDSEEEYLGTNSRTYGGTLCYKRADGGLQVTSLIEFEEYVKCVVPWEISASWNYEALIAFSIVARSYAIKNKCSRFKTYGIDLYDDSYDQVYGGYTKVTDSVVRAVEETEGLVAFYDGEIASLFYSSLTGGYVISNQAAWGSDPIDYLQTKETPWESYVDRKNGLWEIEISAKELAASLRKTASCSKLTSPIKSITINSTAGESGYVTSITFVDTAGHTATVGNTTTMVKKALSDVVRSSNFVVGRGSVECEYDIIKNISISDSGMGSEQYEQNPTLFDKFYLSSYSVKSKDGKMQASEKSMSMITFSGRRTVNIKRANVLTADNFIKLYNEGFDFKKLYTDPVDPIIPPVYTDDMGVTVELTHMTKTVYASSSDSFVFVGKGWGHGVGMSQYGVRDLANVGMSGESIIKTYFDGVEIAKYYK